MHNRIPVILLALSLAACEPRQPQDVPPPPASPDKPAAAPADATPSPAPAAAPAQDPGSTPAAPAQPAPNAPPPTAPSPAPKPTASNATPAVESMAMARPSAKMSIAADLRYQFDAPVVEGQAATLHLAAIPRVAGDNFKIEVKPQPGLEIDRGTLALQKVQAAGIYRQQLSVIRRAGAPGNLSVLVTMDMPEGTAFGFFSIPLASGQIPGGNPAQKTDSVKQR